MKNKKGISLIVLVITIIVMIILAATIIISLSNNGIVEKAKDAVQETNEAQLKQIIAMAWSEARLKDTTEIKDDEYYYKEVMNSLKESGVTDKDLEGYEIIATTQGATITSKLNEYGFFYDKLYLAENTTETVFGYVLHKDGSAEYYEQQNGKLFCVNALPAGSAVYAKNQITLGSLTGTVSNEGKSLTSNGTTATLQTLEKQEVQYSYEYEAVVDGTTWLVVVDKTSTLTLYEVISDGERNETATSVQILGDGHYITNITGEVVAYVSYDGKNILTKVESTDTLFTLTERKSIVHKGIIPEGAVYYVGVDKMSSDYTTATATYKEGDPFPEINTGDIYIYGDYEYRYNLGSAFGIWGAIENQTGWGVSTIDKTKVEYVPVLNEINNEPTTVMLFAYWKCTNMIEAPKIPDTVTILSYAFFACSSLEVAPILPANVELLASTFLYCNNLKTYASSSEEEGYFLNYIIPASITNMRNTFTECTSIKTTPNLKNANALKDLGGAFKGCISLEKVTELPNGVEDLLETFNGCTSLVTAPVIPSSVKILDGTFKKCTSLTGNVTINATPNQYSSTFSETVKPIKIVGTCPTEIKQAMTLVGSNISY